MRVFLGLLLLAASLPAQAVIYKITDGDGHTTFTDTWRPGAIKVADDLKSPAATAPEPQERKKKPASRTSPSHFPRIDAATQRKRDDTRRQLLHEELNSEQRSLEAARRGLAIAGQRPEAERAMLVESVRLHEKNIEMLNQELGRIK